MSIVAILARSWTIVSKDLLPLITPTRLSGKGVGSPALMLNSGIRLSLRYFYAFEPAVLQGPDNEFRGDEHEVYVDSLPEKFV